MKHFIHPRLFILLLIYLFIYCGRKEKQIRLLGCMRYKGGTMLPPTGGPTRAHPERRWHKQKKTIISIEKKSEQKTEKKLINKQQIRFEKYNRINGSSIKSSVWMPCQSRSGNEVKPFCHLLEKRCSYMLRSHASIYMYILSIIQFCGL